MYKRQPLYFAMSRDPAALAALHEKAAAAVRQYLDAGQDVACLLYTSCRFCLAQRAVLVGKEHRAHPEGPACPSVQKIGRAHV